MHKLCHMHRYIHTRTHMHAHAYIYEHIYEWVDIWVHTQQILIAIWHIYEQMHGYVLSFFPFHKLKTYLCMHASTYLWINSWVHTYMKYLYMGAIEQYTQIPTYIRHIYACIGATSIHIEHRYLCIHAFVHAYINRLAYLCMNMYAFVMLFIFNLLCVCVGQVSPELYGDGQPRLFIYWTVSSPLTQAHDNSHVCDQFNLIVSHQ